MSETLQGRVAIVTGAGRGIGRAIAKALAAEGALVAVTARTQSQIDETVAMIDAGGGRAIAVAADIAEPAAVAAMSAEVVRTLGPVDLLVNNAAHSSSAARLWEADPDEWWRGVEVNLRGPFLAIRAVLPSMIERGAGRIINISSRSAGIPAPGRSEYAASKAALVRLTDTLDAELKEFGISVFAVHPGRVPTEASKRFMASPAGQRWSVEAAAELKLLEAPPERCADLCAILASGRADGLSGRFLSIFDDIEYLAAHAEDVQRDDTYALRLRKEAPNQER
jgi:NAD(P)-dependent dehydrogenase (short-subunit alcohol dehydrogenase family)